MKEPSQEHNSSTPSITKKEIVNLDDDYSPNEGALQALQELEELGMDMEDEPSQTKPEFSDESHLLKI
jgi:hypothetical protein